MNEITRFLAYYAEKKSIYVYNLHTLEHEFVLHDAQLIAHNTGTHIATYHNNETILILKTKNGACIQALKTEATIGTITAACFNHNNWLLTTCSDDRHIRIWDIASGLCIKKIHYYSKINEVFFNADESQLIVHSHFGNPDTLDIATGERKYEFQMIFYPISIMLSHDKKQLICRSDYKISIWNIETGKKHLNVHLLESLIYFL